MRDFLVAQKKGKKKRSNRKNTIHKSFYIISECVFVICYLTAECCWQYEIKSCVVVQMIWWDEKIYHLVKYCLDDRSNNVFVCRTDGKY